MNNKKSRTDVVANRQRILCAAREVFAMKGLAAEVMEIADRAGVGVGTIYRHFKNREGLVDALITESGWELLKEIPSVSDDMEPVAAFRDMLHAAARWCDHLGVFVEDVISGRVGNAETHSAYTEEYFGKITALLQKGVEQGAFRKDMDIPVAIAQASSLFYWRKTIDPARQRSFTEVADAIADFMLHGMINQEKA